jgi:hypothetical protein
MTADRPDGGWDDGRLDAAFAARAGAAPATPRDRVETVVADLPARRAPRHGWSRFALAAAVAGLAVVIGGGALLNQKAPTPGPSSSRIATSNASATAAPPPTLAPTSAVVAALGGALTVTDALAVRQFGEQDREIRVRGFLSHAPAMFCPLVVGPGNPTIITCPENWQWLMEQPERLASNQPAGPALHASFALVEPPLPLGSPSDPPVPVELIGHFNDRRAQLCDAMDVCEETFVVDRVVKVDGATLPVSTARRPAASPIDLEEDVDALVTTSAPGAMVVSRQLVTVAAVFDIEPVLRDDMTLSAWANTADLIWLVTAIDTRLDGAVARTFALLDGVNWLAEITANGATLLDGRGVAGSPAPPAVLPSANPTAFAGAPTSVLGIPVHDIASIQRERATTMDSLGRDELAIRAWYLAPPPSVVCAEPPPAVHAPTPPCDEARHWLLDEPQQFGREEGQLRRNPAANLWPPVLNPLVPVDVAFDAEGTWVGDAPRPRPVVVLGHFLDNRVDVYAGSVYFVIDALAWVSDGTVGPVDSVVRLSPNATEDVAAVIDRVAAESDEKAVATWATAIEAVDVGRMHQEARSIPEFQSGAPVWMIRRLVSGERDGRQRLAIEWAWTADHGSRVWATECPDCAPDLATSIDLHDPDASTSLVSVRDYGRQIAGATSAAGLGPRSWQDVGPIEDFIDVARGGSNREVVIRWQGAACATSWRLDISSLADGSIVVKPSTHAEGCAGDEAYEGPTVPRRIVITFDRPVELDSFRTIDGGCCG